MNYCEWLSHFNPNHDSETGRFTTSKGTFLKAGTRLNSVTGRYKDADAYKNSGKWMYTYRDSETWDNKVYKGPFAEYLVKARGARFIAEHQYETTKDLKMPSQQERIDEFKKLNRKKLAADLKSIQKQLIYYNVGNETERANYRAFNPMKIENDHDWDVAYSMFSHMMEASYYYKSTREYCKKMSKKYDAMVDDNNKGVYNNAVDPIIIFRANKVLKKIENEPITKFMTYSEIQENLSYVQEELAKQGVKVKL